MENFDNILEGLALDQIAPGGYHLALNVGFAFPEYELNTLPPDWVRTYTKSGMMIFDPVIRWVYENSGVCRWSEIEIDDDRSILVAAADAGLRYGAVVSITEADEKGHRSFGSFVRPDREFEAEELATLEDCVFRLHEALRPKKALTEAELEVLSHLGAGLMLKEISHLLGISESAVKLRLVNARNKLGARTNTQAVGHAKRYGWI